MVEICHAVSTGRPALGHYAVTSGPVLYWLADDANVDRFAEAWRVVSGDAKVENFHLCQRNPRKNGAAVDRMCSSIREFGFKIPVLAHSDGDVVGHLRLKVARTLGSWSGGDISAIPVDPVRRADPAAS